MNAKMATDATSPSLSQSPVQGDQPGADSPKAEVDMEKLVAPLPLPQRVLNLIVIMLPFAALIAAMVHVWGWGFDWLQFGILLGMYVVTGLGVTVGYHRLFTHRSFETNPVVRGILGVLGSMAIEGPLLRWVATHRCHHQHSDHDEDPHSPHTFGGGAINIARGLWRAHAGWILERSTNDLKRYVKDYENDRLVKAISALFPFWAIMGLLIPGVIAGLITMTWTGALLGVLWGGLVRVFFVHHVTWSINSVCHVWGSQPFRSHDESRNNPIFGIIGFGEGWHNNHHAFPTSARHGLKWWQIDTSYLVILIMSWLGLARNVRVPSAQRIEAKRR